MTFRLEDGDRISDEEERNLPTSPTDEELFEVSASGRPWVDHVFDLATNLAAERLEEISRTGESLTETRHQQPAFRQALQEVQDGVVDQSEITLDLPNWDPNPGGVDVIVRGSSGEPRIAAELKLWRTDWMLWDALKMIDALNVGDLEAAYLVMGTNETGWSSRLRACSIDGKTTELFQPGEIVHDTRKLFTDNAHAWYDLLTGGTGRPTRVPAAIKTSLITEASLSFEGKSGSLRTVRVESASDDWIYFNPDWHGGEWPQGVEPCEHYLEWRQTD